MTQSLNATILRNLLIERELCIAKLQFTTERLEQLERQIGEMKFKVERETAEKTA